MGWPSTRGQFGRSDGPKLPSEMMGVPRRGGRPFRTHRTPRHFGRHFGRFSDAHFGRFWMPWNMVFCGRGTSRRTPCRPDEIAIQHDRAAINQGSGDLVHTTPIQACCLGRLPPVTQRELGQAWTAPGFLYLGPVVGKQPLLPVPALSLLLTLPPPAWT